MDRKHLPDTRASVTRRIEHTPNMDIYVIVGFFEPIKLSVAIPEDIVSTEQPGEVFIKLAKEGNTLGGLCDVIGVMMSLMLQYNIPWERIARKIRYTNFEPTDHTGKSIAHAIVTAVDHILSERGSIPDKGWSL